MGNLSGIYLIINTANGKVYVGQAVNLAKRKRNHFSALKLGKHRNKHLQAAYNQYGGEAFVFEVVQEFTDAPDKQDLAKSLARLEQHWIDFYQSTNPEYGYNMCPSAGSSLGYKHSAETRAKVAAAGRGRVSSPDTRAKISAAHKGKRLSSAHRANLSKSHIGQKGRSGWKFTPDQLAKLSEAQSKNFIAIDPGGIEYHDKNLARFCRQHNLNVGNMAAVARGKRKHYKGWIIRYIEAANGRGNISNIPVLG